MKRLVCSEHSTSCSSLPLHPRPAGLAHLQCALDGEGVDAHEAVPAGRLRLVGSTHSSRVVLAAQGHLDQVGRHIDRPHQVPRFLRQGSMRAGRQDGVMRSNVG